MPFILKLPTLHAVPQLSYRSNPKYTAGTAKCYTFSITEFKPIESGGRPLKVGPMDGANGVGH